MTTLIYFQMSISVFIIIFVLIKEKGLKLYHPVIIFSIVFFLQYTIPTIYMASSSEALNLYHLDINMLNKGYFFVLISYILFLAGYYFSIYNEQLKKIIVHLLTRIPNINDYSLHIKNLPLIIIILLIIGWIARTIMLKLGIYFHIEVGERISHLQGFKLFGEYFGIASTFPLIALAIIYFEYIKNPTKKVYLFLTFVFLASEVVYALPSGGKERIFLPLFIIMVIRSLRHKFPIFAGLTVGAILIFFIFPFTTIYREIYTYRGNLVSNFSEALNMYLFLFSKFDSNTIVNLFNSIFGEQGRLNYASVACVVVNYTPQIWDFLKGYTYYLFVVSLIPRIFWPSKPDISVLGNEFGIDYGITHVGSITTINITLFGEMFLNFGWFSLPLSIFYGFLYRFIFSYFTKYGKMTTLAILLYSFTLYQMVRLDLFAPTYSGLLKYFLVFIILFSPFMKRVTAR